MEHVVYLLRHSIGLSLAYPALAGIVTSGTQAPGGAASGFGTMCRRPAGRAGSKRASGSLPIHFVLDWHRGVSLLFSSALL